MQIIQNVFKATKYDGVNIKLVNNGREAEIYLNNIIANNEIPNIDLVILELELFEFDSMKLLSLLKTSEITKEIPVVIFGNSAITKDISNSYRLHANCFIQKPIALKDYENTMETIKSFWMNSEVVSLPNT